MALNPFFLQGSANEQFLLQDLINEHLRTYGIDVYYIPRKVLGQDNIIREIEASKFNDNFAIEAYLENFEGYAPGSDIMTKFGIVILELYLDGLSHRVQCFNTQVGNIRDAKDCTLLNKKYSSFSSESSLKNS